MHIEGWILAIDYIADDDDIKRYTVSVSNEYGEIVQLSGLHYGDVDGLAIGDWFWARSCCPEESPYAPDEDKHEQLKRMADELASAQTVASSRPGFRAWRSMLGGCGDDAGLGEAVGVAGDRSHRRVFL